MDRLFSVLQTIAVNGAKSDWAPVLSGVPHGTVLVLVVFFVHS